MGSGTQNIGNSTPDTAGEDVTREYTGGAAHVADVFQVTRESITPDVGGNPQSRQEFGDGSNDIRYLYATGNAIADGVAAQRFLDGFPDVIQINPGDLGRMLSDTAITTLHVLAIGDTTAGTLASGEQVAEGESIANIQTALVRFDFTSGDNVKSASVKVSEPYSSTASPATAASFVNALVMGFKHD